MNSPLDGLAVSPETFADVADGAKEVGVTVPDELADYGLRLELPAATLFRLLADGHLCAADFRCLDCDSKDCVWRLLMLSSAKSLRSVTGCDGRCEHCESNGHAKSERGSAQSVLQRYPTVPVAQTKRKQQDEHRGQ